MRLIRPFDLPPVWLAGFAALVWAQGRILGVGLPGPWAAVMGWALICGGVGLMGLAGLEFLRHRTTIVPRQRPRDLIDTGVYRVTRNPIYLGDTLVLAGLCFLWDALPSLVLVPVFGAVISRRFIRGEERGLIENFGPAAEAYMARVHRWL
ncbi:isoprenylcysteine carboxylmethyltransferase family protein [Maritimibacter sp. 55A14]|uniref:methyltransferase family protein n=1 Tax=Maritimibacter sp. 55A14 TaxID=2174844 RepID=UPI001E4CC62F|nr:isoprenylcysteine carboxylmethyltransferase family protein [Maritimibacter sp. 55A14]